MDATDYYTRLKESNEDKFERSQQEFLDYIDEDICTIIDIVAGLRKIARNWDEGVYDMSEELEERLKDIL